MAAIASTKRNLDVGRDVGPLRIGVIGSVNRDSIASVDGCVRRSLGGALYTALALAHLGGDRVEVQLVSRVGADVVDEIDYWIGRCPPLRSEGLLTQESPNYHCQIQYRADGGKTEILSGSLEPLNPDELRPLISRLDGLLVNFITGFELDLETMLALRRETRGTVLIDIHSLVLGRADSGERFWRRPDNWQDWISLADVVQMNEDEAAVLGDLDGSEADELSEFALSTLRLGPKGAVVTRGQKGGVAAWRDAEAGSTEVFEFSAPDPHLAVDSTGCGDVFLAAMGLATLGGERFPQAVAIAARAAAANSRLRGIEQLEALPHVFHSEIERKVT